VAATGIAGLMDDAGLTHGGFYAHFESKEALVREAIAAALDATRHRLDRAAARDDAGLEGLIRHYLRPAHRDNPAQGCALAALAAEIARHEPATREVFATRAEAFLDRIIAHLPEGAAEAKKSPAIGILSVLLGALQLARVVTDAALSDQILESGIKAALTLAQTAG
jgi:AcrR family transcriptional regulator